MRRLGALCLAAAAAGSLAPAAHAALQFERRCSGTVDTRCYSDLCGIADCVRRDCLVYSGVVGDWNTPLCVGQARPQDPED
jgi:hypothetical protein